MKKIPVKYVKATDENKKILSRFPNAGPRPNITGMRRIYGPRAYLIKCGNYLYSVTPDIYSRVE